MRGEGIHADTQYFQRMRDIAQLGCVEYVSAFFAPRHCTPQALGSCWVARCRHARSRPSRTLSVWAPGRRVGSPGRCVTSLATPPSNPLRAPNC